MSKPKQFFKKNNKAGRLTLPDISTFYKATVSRKYNIGIRIDLYINGRERELRSRPTNLWSIDFQQRCQGNSMWKTIVFSTHDAGRTIYPFETKRISILLLHHTQNLI